MKKIKVLILGNFPYFESYNSIGGVEASILAFISGITDHKVNKTFYFLSFSKSHQKGQVLHPRFNIVILQFPLGKYLPFVKFIVGRTISGRVIERIHPDVINFIGSGPTILYLKRKIRKSAILTQHGIIEEEIKYTNTLYQRLLIFLKIIVDKIFLIDFQYRLFISHYIENLTNKSKIKLSQVISNPVNKSFFDLKTKGYPNNIETIKKIVVIGNISPLKNQKLGLKLARMLLLNKINNFKLIFIGHVKNEKYYAELLSYIEENQEIKDHIEFKGSIKHEFLIDYLASSNYLLILSLQENTPMVIAEAQSMGKVVIAPNIGGIAEMIHDKKSGFLYNRNDLEHLFSIFQNFFNNFDYNEISIEAYRWARSNYYPEIIVKNISEFYDEYLKLK